jgi:hypothetical protein
MPGVKTAVPALAIALAVLAGACSTGLDTTSASDTTGVTSEPDPVTTTTSNLGRLPTTTTSAPPVAVPLSTLAPDTPLCDTLQEIGKVGELNADALVETSGIVVSRTYPSVIWAHNDSGGEAIVYALATDGTLLSSHRIGDAFPLDMEDIALGPGPDPSIDYLYVADIGDNLHFRPDVLVYRIPEPTPSTDGTAAGVEKIRLAYPEPGINSEALAVDPVTGDIFLFAKTRTDPVTIYRAQADLFFGDEPTPLEPVGTVGIADGSEVTAADVSANGDRIALRGYQEVWVWPRSDADLAATLQREPCEGASPDEVQGEALAFSADATVMYTISEGSGAAINRVGP